jgi:hypothetical protein
MLNDWVLIEYNQVVICKLLKTGAPGVIRTHDLLVRSQTLYPAELRAH